MQFFNATQYDWLAAYSMKRALNQKQKYKKKLHLIWTQNKRVFK